MSIEIQKQFVADARAAGFEVRTYSGRFYYHGFGVDAASPDELVDAVSCSLNKDSMGRGVILYPTSGVSEEEMYELAKELQVGEDDEDENLCNRCGVDDIVYERWGSRDEKDGPEGLCSDCYDDANEEDDDE
jgi:hypothetical protein